MSKITLKDYPLYVNKPEQIRTLTGKSLDEITIEAILKGDLTEDDVRLSPQTLELQAQVLQGAQRQGQRGNG